ncbi:MAG: UDP-2,3-diacylglucosamine diphosphatase [Planctomycetes bacterium]|nr:UDP-2,3-diacylglucosamine diphosphatase [Planctomycetota bacterium]
MDFSTLFISDLHLRLESEALNEVFYQFLEVHAPKAKRLVINGDFVNSWWGRPTVETPFAKELAQRLSALKGKCEVHFVNGNRDFLLSDDAEFLNMKGHGDGLVFDGEGTRIAVTHGDQFCLSDRGHQLFRWATRVVPLHPLSRLVPAGKAEELAAWFRERSRQKGKQNEERPYAFYDLTDEAMERYIAKNSAEVLIVGHIHKPQERHLLVDGRMRRVLVLSDWNESGAIIAGTLESGQTELLQLDNGEIRLWPHTIRANARVSKEG